MYMLFLLFCFFPVTLVGASPQSVPTITWSTPAAITYGTALSAAQLNATASVAGTFVYTPASGTVLKAGSQTLSVTFTPTDTADYTTATATVKLTVNKAMPTITWATPAAITYGTALSTAQLNATASVVGKFAYTPASGTVLKAGSQTLSVTFTPTDTTDYAAATATVVLRVNVATPAIKWATPAAITYGKALSATQLNATAPVAGSFIYTPASGTVLTVGSQTLSVTFTPTDATDYTTATATVVLTVNVATPAIKWATPAAITYGKALSATQLNATSPVAGSFVYTPASGAVLTAGSQTLSVTFTPTDTADYTTATATVMLTVNLATPAITWATPAAITYGTALSATQLNATSPVAGAFAYTPASGTVLTAGSQTLSVTFTPADTADYTTKTATVKLTVNKFTPTVTWATPAAITYGTALSATQLNATSTVDGAFAYTPASGTVLTAGSQTLSVTFTPTDTADYATKTTTVKLTVNKVTSTVTWATPAAITYGTALSTTQLNATASVAGTFVYSPVSGTVLTVGSHSLAVTFTPTDTVDYTTANAAVTLTVSKATPVITWATPAPIAYGTALSATQLDASSTTAGTFAYTPAAGTVLKAGSQALSVTFTPADTVDYTTAKATVTLTVNKATPVITWATPAPITYGTTLSATQLDASSPAAGTFAYTPAAGAVLKAGSQALSVTFTPADTTDYSTATATVTLTVNAATPAITWATPAAITYGTGLSATQLDATSVTAGAFIYSPTAGTVLTAGAQTLWATFTPADSTDYTTATSSVSIRVNPAIPAITWPAPAAIAYGTALSATQLDASSTIPGTFVYSPAAGTVLAAGSQILSVTFTPTDTTDYTAATQTVTLTVGSGASAPLASHTIQISNDADDGYYNNEDGSGWHSDPQAGGADWVGSWGGTTTAWVPGYRFESTGINSGDTIQSAYLQLVSSDDKASNATCGSEPCVNTNSTFRVYGVAQDDGATFSGTPGNTPLDVPYTVAYTDYTSTGPGDVHGSCQGQNNGQNTCTHTIDVTNIVKEITARPGWTSTSAMRFVMLSTDAAAPNVYAGYEDYSANPAKAATLLVNPPVPTIVSSGAWGTSAERNYPTIYSTGPFVYPGASTLLLFLGDYYNLFGNPNSQPAVSDSCGNTWNILAGPTNWAGIIYGMRSTVYYVQNPASCPAGDTITITVDDTTDPIFMHFLAVAGSDPTQTPVASAITSPSPGTYTTSAASNPITLTNAGLLVSWIFGDSDAPHTFTPQMGFVTDVNSTPNYLTTVTESVSSPGSYQSQFSISPSDGWQVVTIALAAPVVAPPVITSSGAASATAGVAFSYQITATNSPASFGASGLPAGLTVNTASGLISGTPTGPGTFNVTATATNSAGATSAPLTLTVTVVPPVITSSGTASGTIGSPFSYQITAANLPASFGASGLPTGLTVNAASGLISGTPTAAGTSTVTLSATNSAGTGNATLTLGIVVPAPVITSPMATSGTVGDAFSYQITASNAPTSYAATGLPAGLTLNSGTGLISGTPTVPGISTVALSATNSGGTGSATLTLTVVAVPVITSAATVSGNVGSAFSYQITASNAPSSFGALGLPDGLSVNRGTGLISGTPTAAGTSTVTLSATNSAGTGSATLTLTVTLAPAITSAAAASGMVGTAFSYQITATNTPTSFGATGLPAGLTVDIASGLISGTPTAAGTSTVTLSAVNSVGTGMAPLTLTVSSGSTGSLVSHTIQISNDADDGYYNNQDGSGWNLDPQYDGADLVGSWGGTTTAWVPGYRFESTGINSGDTIQAAYLQLVSSDGFATSATCGSAPCPDSNSTFRVYGVAQDDGATFSGTPGNTPLDVPYTAAFTDYTSTGPGDVHGSCQGNNNGQNTCTHVIDVTNIVKEITARPGWTSTSAMRFVMLSTNAAAPNVYAGYEDYSANPAKAATLLVNPPAPTIVSSGAWGTAPQPTYPAAYSAGPFVYPGASTLLLFLGDYYNLFGNPNSQPAVSDSCGNTWNILAGPTNWAGIIYGMRSTVYYVQNPASCPVGDTITITVADTTDPIFMHFLAVAGSDTTQPPVVSAITSPSSGTYTTSAASNPITLTNAGLLVSWIFGDSDAPHTFTPQMGFVTDVNSTPNYLTTVTESVSSPGSYQSQFSISPSDGWQVVTIALAAPVVAPR